MITYLRKYQATVLLFQKGQLLFPHALCPDKAQNGEVKKVDGQKVQEVRIVYNFVGEIPEIAA